jgi:hypothetical protein
MMRALAAKRAGQRRSALALQDLTTGEGVEATGGVRRSAGNYSLERFDTTPRPLSIRQARRQPSWLLAARHKVVPFEGRSAELLELAAWRDDAEAALSVMLLHGAGGQGKTRWQIDLLN